MENIGVWHTKVKWLHSVMAAQGPGAESEKVCQLCSQLELWLLLDQKEALQTIHLEGLKVA